MVAGLQTGRALEANRKWMGHILVAIVFKILVNGFVGSCLAHKVAAIRFGHREEGLYPAQKPKSLPL